MWIILFNLAYIVPFTLFYLLNKNYEFLWYVLVLLGFVTLIIATLYRSRFGVGILWGLSLWGFLHMAGGGIKVAGDVLYALRLFPFYDGGADFYILKYDQVVHLFGFAVATFVVYHLLKPYLNDNVRWSVVYLIILVAGTGFGVLNEIVEFIAVLVFSETGVGGYYNTSLDLVFNTIGAFLAVLLIHYQRIRKLQNK